MTYQIGPFPMNLSDQSHSLIADLLKCNFSYSCSAVDKISTNMVHHAELLQSTEDNAKHSPNHR